MSRGREALRGQCLHSDDEALWRVKENYLFRKEMCVFCLLLHLDMVKLKQAAENPDFACFFYPIAGIINT